MTNSTPRLPGTTAMEVYRLLERLIGSIETMPMNAKSVIGAGLMDLNLDRLAMHRDGDNTRIDVAISHYFKHQSGDMIADPDMVFHLFPKQRMAEAVSFQDQYRYVDVTDLPWEKAVKPYRDINVFSVMWLSNSLSYGHLFLRAKAA